MADTDKKSRWRKDKRENSGADQVSLGTSAAQPFEKTPLASKLASLEENLAAKHAFRGLHGGRSEFSMVNGAVDKVYQSVLGGNAYYYQGVVCPSNDYSMYEALLKELEYKPHWMQGGTKLRRPTAVGSEETLNRSPTYLRIVKWMSEYFGVQPLRSLVNYYRNGDDSTGAHSDQYFSGVNMTIGASFGEERALAFEHKDSGEQFTFPQYNGDIFAFTEEVNRAFTHAVPKQKQRARSVGACRHTPGRISVIIFARRPKDGSRFQLPGESVSLLPCPHILDYDPAVPAAADVSEAQEEQDAEDQVAAEKELEQKPEADVLEGGAAARRKKEDNVLQSKADRQEEELAPSRNNNNNNDDIDLKSLSEPGLDQQGTATPSQLKAARGGAAADKKTADSD
eukprot:CAMPEP_0206443522 /NCGR_PEP_ID=MMETSP0324_2-20121206/14413_1 /ASSEMBLY_ACC=CAM_ASM_000836 /TAXON_ID=2866 /ORGANISM="Crypthecodinium cohnii, Strain Seligo" /LENGTH=396 /DNA_ID=CAMNT_0053911463 /DNA_START=126 /DNA_END=1317 /DNA_ORIENTATION=-